MVAGPVEAPEFASLTTVNCIRSDVASLLTGLTEYTSNREHVASFDNTRGRVRPAVRNQIVSVGGQLRRSRRGVALRCAINQRCTSRHALGVGRDVLIHEDVKRGDGA